MDFIIAIILVVTFVIIGNIIYKLSTNKAENPFIEFGTSYFFGISFVIVFIRFVSYFFSLHFAIIFLMIFLGLLIYFNNKILRINIKRISDYKNTILKTFLLLTIIYPFFLLFWLHGPLPGDPFVNIGSLESFRYSELSKYFYNSDNIPIINQNFGQSILTAVSLIAGVKSANIFLSLLLYFSIVFFALFIFGIVSEKIQDKKWRLILSTIFLMGNTALSSQFVLVQDTFYPLLLSGYTDTLLGVFIILYFIRAVASYFSKEIIYTEDKMILFLLFTVSYFVAPQNIYVIGFLLFAGLLALRISFFKNKIIMSIFVVFFLSGAFSIFQGGMLTPKLFVTKSNVPGVYNVSGYTNSEARNSGVKLTIGLAHQVAVAKDWYSGGIIFDSSSIKESINGKTLKSLWYVETKIFNDLRIIFFPLLGLFLLYIFNKSYRTESYDAYIIFIKIGFVFFIAGYLVAGLVSINGYKWELTRFLLPFIVVGMVSLVHSFILFINHNQIINYKKFLYMTIIIILFGPIMYLVEVQYKNILNNTNIIRLEMFVGLNEK